MERASDFGTVCITATKHRRGSSQRPFAGVGQVVLSITPSTTAVYVHGSAAGIVNDSKPLARGEKSFVLLVALAV
jgi:hypothetical protein